MLFNCIKETRHYLKKKISNFYLTTISNSKIFLLSSVSCNFMWFILFCAKKLNSLLCLNLKVKNICCTHSNSCLDDNEFLTILTRSTTINALVSFGSFVRVCVNFYNKSTKQNTTFSLGSTRDWVRRRLFSDNRTKLVF